MDIYNRLSNLFIGGNKMFVFGYGSLINKSSLERTCPQSRLVSTAYLKGWRRHLNMPLIHSNNLYNGKFSHAFSIDRGSLNDRVNGVLIEVSPSELLELDKRESHYSRVDVELFDSKTNQKLKDGIVFAVTEYEPTAVPWDHPFSKQYVETCLKGCLNFGTDYLNEFLKSSFDMDKPFSDIEEVDNILNSMENH
ncbi:MAG: hypothetical protein COA79_23920 [Planctomycetota bacterium]|nr:MAG: hypothetical protein COA79_23920 [Planctomycetota bacterium]